MAGWSYDSTNKRIYNADTANDDLIIGTASTEFVSGTELKLFFDKSKGALRVGSVSGTSWNDASRGNQSVALGTDTVASGAAAVALGSSSTASGSPSLAAGSTCTASGTDSVALGNTCTASGAPSFAWGQSATASGRYAVAFGAGAVSTRLSQVSFSALWNGGPGDAQKNIFIAKRTTTNATPVPLLFDDGQFTSNTVTLTGVNTNVLTVPISRGHKFKITVIAKDQTNNVFAGYKIEGCIVRGGSGNARFISTPVVTVDEEASASAWDCGVTVDTSDATNNYLALTVTGAASTTIEWVACLETVEVA